MNSREMGHGILLRYQASEDRHGTRHVRGKEEVVVLYSKTPFSYCERKGQWYITLHMHLDPHTLSLIIQRIEKQMRCPQCGKRVPVDFAAVRIVGDDFLLLQLKCNTCEAFIVLHASLQGTAVPIETAAEPEGMHNASSTLTMSELEIKMLQEALSQSGGSFEALFKKYGSSDKKD